jgi:hypothetical protein
MPALNISLKYVFKEINVRVTLPVLEITGCQMDARRNRKGQHQ